MEEKACNIEIFPERVRLAITVLIAVEKGIILSLNLL
jgi:hypothetical protein